METFVSTKPKKSNQRAEPEQLNQEQASRNPDTENSKQKLNKLQNQTKKDQSPVTSKHLTSPAPLTDQKKGKSNQKPSNCTSNTRKNRKRNLNEAIHSQMYQSPTANQIIAQVNKLKQNKRQPDLEESERLSPLALNEESFNAAPLNPTKGRQKHPATSEAEIESIPNEHPPFMTSLNTPICPLKFNDRSSPRLRVKRENTESENHYQLKMDQCKDIIHFNEAQTKIKAELKSESKLHRVGQNQGISYQIVCHTEPNFDQICAEEFVSNHSSKNQHKVPSIQILEDGKSVTAGNRNSLMTEKVSIGREPHFDFDQSYPQYMDHKDLVKADQRRLRGNLKDDTLESQSKLELRRQVNQLQQKMKQKDNLIHLMTAEIQNLQMKLRIESQNNIMLRVKFDQRNDYFQMGEQAVQNRMIEHSIQAPSNQQKMHKTNSLSHQPVRKKQAVDWEEESKDQSQEQRLQMSSSNHINYPSASPSSLPLQMKAAGLQSQQICFTRMPQHEPITKKSESAPQSSLSSERKEKLPGQQSLLIADEESAQKQAAQSMQKASHKNGDAAPVDMKINDEYNSNAAKPMLLQNHSTRLAQKRRSPPKELKLANEKVTKTKHCSDIQQPFFEEQKRSKSKKDQTYQKLDSFRSATFQPHLSPKSDKKLTSIKSSSSSSDSSRRPEGKAERVKHGNSTGSFYTSRSQIQLTFQGNVESENVLQDIQSSLESLEESKSDLNLSMGDKADADSLQQSSQQLQENPQPVNSFNPPTQASQVRKSFANPNEDSIDQIRAPQQQIDENGARNIVRQSLSNRRARDLQPHSSPRFGLNSQLHQEPIFKSQIHKTQAQFQLSPLYLQRLSLTQQFQPNQTAQQRRQDQQYVEELMLENLIGANQSASVNYDLEQREQRNVQQINQIIRASNGSRDPNEEEKQERINEFISISSQREDDPGLNENERSFEHELADDNNQFTTNESILINKVNEMQIKTSRFDHQRNKYLFRNPREIQQRERTNDQQNLLHQMAINQHQRTTQQNLILTYVQHMQQQTQFRRNTSNQGANHRHLDSQANLTFNMGEMLGNFGARVGANSSQNIQNTLSARHIIHNRINNQMQGQLNHLHQQRPCEQLPPSNIRGDIQSHVDAEEFNQNVEGVCSGLVAQRRIPLPNQQHQPLPRNPSQDSFVNDPADNDQISMRDYELSMAIEASHRHHLAYAQDGLYDDDVGMDEFDVADERAHLFGEQVNPDIMTYEQLIALQERIGYVNKGMTVKEMDKFPQMKFCQLKNFLKGKHKLQSENLIEVEEVKFGGCGVQHCVREEFKQHRGFGNNRSADLSYQGHPRYLFEGEEERKSLLDNESNQEKSETSSLSFPNEIQMYYDTGVASLRDHVNRVNNRFKEKQIQKFIFKSQSSREIRDSQSSRQIHHSQRNLHQDDQHEEGKEDLEDAAPEENHPKEEQMQQINVAASPMPGHYIQSFSSSNFMVANEDSDGSSSNENQFEYLKKRKNLCRSNVIQSNSTPLQQIRVNPPARNIVNQVLVSDIQPKKESSFRQLESLDEENEEGSQEDVFDEGEDISNRRMPHLASINGSIPNQKSLPFRVIKFLDEEDDVFIPPSRKENGFVVPVFPEQSQEDAIEVNRKPSLSQAQAEILVREQEQYYYQPSRNSDLHSVIDSRHQQIIQQPMLLSHNQSNQLRQALDDAMHADRVNQANFPRSMSQLSLAFSQKSPMSVQEEIKYQIEGVNNNHRALMQSEHQSDHSLLHKSLMSSKTGDICIICQYQIKQDDSIKLLTPCNHYFHVNCVNQWLLVEKKCPLCMNALP